MTADRLYEHLVAHPPSFPLEPERPYAFRWPLSETGRSPGAPVSESGVALGAPIKPRNRQGTCALCGQTMWTHAPAKFCSERCRMRMWRQLNPEKYRELERRTEPLRRKRRVHDAQKKHAWNVVAAARRRGRISSQPCEVCGEPDTEAHHDDYSQPLEIRWLCRVHHELLHHGVTTLPVPEARPRSLPSKRPAPSVCHGVRGRV